MKCLTKESLGGTWESLATHSQLSPSNRPLLAGHNAMSARPGTSDTTAAKLNSFLLTLSPGFLRDRRPALGANAAGITCEIVAAAPAVALGVSECRRYPDDELFGDEKQEKQRKDQKR